MRSGSCGGVAERVSNLVSMSHEVVRRVKQTIGAHRMLSPGDAVVVGCSGGADSTCLLHVLAVGLKEMGLRCTAVYVDHGLRPEARAERDLVRRTAESVGAGFDWRKVDVLGRVAAHGGSKQAAARDLRYAALSEVADEVGAGKIAVGHTLTDQAETLLLQLIRGAGTRGIAGIAPVRGRVVRPLLGVRREETAAYCREMGLETAVDPSNESGVYLRNRVRLELLPKLAEFNPSIDEHLANLAEIARAEEEYLDAKAREAASRLSAPVAGSGDAGTSLDAAALNSLPLALARRVVRLVASSLGARSLGFAHVEAILAAARKRSGSETLDHLPGVLVRREYGRLVFLPARASEVPEGAPGSGGREDAPAGASWLDIGGSAFLEWAGMHLAVEEVGPGEWSSPSTAGKPRPAGAPFHAALVDRDALRPPLAARPRRPGDRLSPAGLGGSKKVQDILTDAKVPRFERDRVVVVEDRAGIVWVVGHALDERVRVREGTARAVRLVARPSGKNADRGE